MGGLVPARRAGACNDPVQKIAVRLHFINNIIRPGAFVFPACLLLHYASHQRIGFRDGAGFDMPRETLFITLITFRFEAEIIPME